MQQKNQNTNHCEKRPKLDLRKKEYSETSSAEKKLLVVKRKNTI